MNRSFDAAITFIYTQNLESTCHFYHVVLGLKLILDQGICRIYSWADSAYLGICQRDNIKQPGDQVILTFITSKVDYWYQQFLSHSVEIIKPPTINEFYKIYHFFGRDPNGYLIEVQQFIDERWNKPTNTEQDQENYLA
jgi:predicted enzyme related to lactoylglutathione lyase